MGSPFEGAVPLSEVLYTLWEKGKPGREERAGEFFGRIVAVSDILSYT
jgi:hypothetical protein